MRKTRLKQTSAASVVILLAGVFGLAGLRVADMVPPMTPAGKGAQLFAEMGCTSCHFARSNETKVGPGLEGLFDRDKLPVSGRAATAKNVRRQLEDPYESMPSFEDQLTAEQRDQLIAFLKTL